MMTGDVCFRERYRHPIPRTSRRLLLTQADVAGWIHLLIRHAVSDVDLCTDLDSSSRRYMKISAGIVRGPGQTDKQFVLPVGHFRCFGWPQCTPGQKERCTHHVELEAVCPTGCQANRDVWTFHISKTHDDAREGI